MLCHGTDHAAKFQRPDQVTASHARWPQSPTRLRRSRQQARTCARLRRVISAATTTDATVRATPRAQRLLALDQMRGLVMLLMTLDHASEQLNRSRFVT